MQEISDDFKDSLDDKISCLTNSESHIDLVPICRCQKTTMSMYYQFVYR